MKIHALWLVQQTLNRIMSEKHRNLPQWMVKSDLQRGTDEGAEKKKRTARKQVKSVATYWMNERELVETALSILKDDSTCCRDAVQAPDEEMMMIPETDEDSEVQDRSCVSNIAEQETVPYGNYVEENTSTKADCHFKAPPDGPGAEDYHDVNDEALELVREIFFT